MTGRGEPCRAVQGTGPCGQTDTLALITEHHALYSARLRGIECADAPPQAVIRTLKDWVEELSEQNRLLASTVETLEREALARSHKLYSQQNFESQKLKDDMCEKEDKIKCLEESVKKLMEQLSQKDCKIKQLCKEAEQLKQQIEKQNCQLKECSSGLQKRLECAQAEAKRLEEEVACKDARVRVLELELSSLKKQSGSESHNRLSEMQAQLECLQNRLRDKDNTIEGLDKEAKKLKNEVCQLKSKIEESKRCENTTSRKEESFEIITRTETASPPSPDAVRLTRTIDRLKQSGREMQEALAGEIAEKHDQIVSLKREVSQLEEQLRHADMQTQFKDVIIKELRKEVKISRAKESLVDLLGLRGASAVEMKSKIARLEAELEERSAEARAAEERLATALDHGVETRLTETQLQLAESRRDVLALCDKLDYIKRYLEKINTDEDANLKWGVRAVLHELDQETEWRHKTRRSVTSLAGDDRPPDSVIIINRSHSLPNQTSCHHHQDYLAPLQGLADYHRSNSECSANQNGTADSLEYGLNDKMDSFQRSLDQTTANLHSAIDNLADITSSIQCGEEMREVATCLEHLECGLSSASRLTHSLMAGPSPLQSPSPKKGWEGGCGQEEEWKQQLREIQTRLHEALKSARSHQLRLRAHMDTQKEDSCALKKAIANIKNMAKCNECAVASIKQDISVALCGVTTKAEQVRKQLEQVSSLECAIKELGCKLMKIVSQKEGSCQDKQDLNETYEKLQAKFNSILCGKPQSPADGKRTTFSFSVSQLTREAKQGRRYHSSPQLNEGKEDTADEVKSQCMYAQDLSEEVRNALSCTVRCLSTREKQVKDLQDEVNCWMDQVAGTEEDLCVARQSLVVHGDVRNLTRGSCSFQRETAAYQRTTTLKLSELDQVLVDLNDTIVRFHGGRTSAGKQQIDFSSCTVLEDSHTEYMRQPESYEGTENCETEVASSMPSDLIAQQQEKIARLERTVQDLKETLEKVQWDYEHQLDNMCSEKSEIQNKNQAVIRELQKKICELEDCSKQDNSTVSRKYWAPWMCKQRQHPSPHVHHV